MKRPPKHWAQHDEVVTDRNGRELRMRPWGWSDVSEDDARARAGERVRAIMSRGGPGAIPDDWYYPTGPLREQLIETIGALEEPAAIVTRNRYGVEVLNTDAIVIADIDVSKPKRGLFRRKKADPADAARDRIGGFAKAHPGLGVHSYRTAAGFRVFLTGSALAPGDERATELLEELGSDPLYVTLCRAQKSFRARLTPKPWRVGHTALSARWPAEDRVWLEDYAQHCRGYAVCAHEMSFGPQPSSAERDVLSFHDRVTGVASGLPLA